MVDRLDVEDEVVRVKKVGIGPEREEHTYPSRILNAQVCIMIGPSSPSESSVQSAASSAILITPEFGLKRSSACDAEMRSDGMNLIKP